MSDMINEPLFFYIFAGASFLYVVHIAAYLVGANFYDIWQYRRIQKYPPKDASYIPLVSVIVPAHNEELVIERCLQSVLGSNYSHIQVIVVDDYSTDSTYQLVERFIALHPGRIIRLLRMPSNVGKGSALNYALKRSVRGRFVMTLDADSVLLPDAISNAMRYFDDPNIAGVAANVRIIEEPTVLGMLQKFEHMISYRSKKLYTLLNCEFVIGGVASMYRTPLVRQVSYYDTTTITEDIGLSIKMVAQGNKHNRLVYASDVVAMTEGVVTFRGLMKQRYRWKYGSMQNLVQYRKLLFHAGSRYTKTLTYYRLPLAVISELVLLTSPAAWLYVIYITLLQQNPGLVIGAFVMITLYVLASLWFDEHTSFAHRMRLSLYVPLVYFIFYAMDLVQLAAVVRCILHFRQIASGRTPTRWVSPPRIGRRLSQVHEA